MLKTILNRKKALNIFIPKFVNVKTLKINKMTTLNSRLPDELLDKLSEKAKKLDLPKDKLVEIALRIYLKQIDVVENRTLEENASLKIAEEGMKAYLDKLEKDII